MMTHLMSGRPIKHKPLMKPQTIIERARSVLESTYLKQTLVDA